MATYAQIEELVANMDRSTVPHALTRVTTVGHQEVLFRGTLRECVEYLVSSELLDNDDYIALEPAPVVS